MFNQLQLAKLVYWVNALIMFAIGLAFVFAQEFFPFHRDVIGVDWVDLDARSKTLNLGMMRTEGAGYLATGVAFVFLLVFPLKRGTQRWAIWAITVVGLVEHLPTLLATYHVSQVTPASPPWLATLVCMLSLGIAAALALTSSQRATIAER